MGKPYGMELGARVVSHVEASHTHRATSEHFQTSIKYVNDMVKLKREMFELCIETQLAPTLR